MRLLRALVYVIRMMIGGMLFDARVMLAIHGSISERRIESDLTVQDRARTAAPRLLIV
jgi:hypothetical protein